MDQSAGYSGNSPYQSSKLKELLMGDRGMRLAGEFFKETNGGGGDAVSAAEGNATDDHKKSMNRTSVISSGGNQQESTGEGSSYVAPIKLTFKKVPPAPPRLPEPLIQRIAIPYPGGNPRIPTPFTLDPIHFPPLLEPSPELTHILINPDFSEARDKESVKPVTIRTVVKEREHMQAEIDKLLSMPMNGSWNNHGKKKVPFKCDYCGEAFSKKVVFKLHLENKHKGPSQLEPLDLKELEDFVRESDKLVLEDMVKKNLLPKASFDKAEKRQKLPNKGDESNSATPDEAIDAVLAVNKSKQAFSKESPSTRATRPSRRTDSFAESQKSSVSSDSRKRVAATLDQEAEESLQSPQTPTARSSLRRNIQRPKWLSDADLVTDYEFPRGTNIARTGNVNTPSSASPGSSPQVTPVSTPTTNGNHSQTRRMSAESLGEPVNTRTPRQQKNDKNKVLTRDKMSSEEVAKKEAKKEVPKRQAKREVGKEKTLKATKSPMKAKLRPKKSNTAEPETQAKLPATNMEAIVASVLTLSPLPIAQTPTEDKGMKAEKKVARKPRKRAGSVGDSADKGVPPRKSKRKRLSEADEKSSSIAIPQGSKGINNDKGDDSQPAELVVQPAIDPTNQVHGNANFDSTVDEETELKVEDESVVPENLLVNDIANKEGLTTAPIHQQMETSSNSVSEDKTDKNTLELSGSNPCVSGNAQHEPMKGIDNISTVDDISEDMRATEIDAPSTDPSIPAATSQVETSAHADESSAQNIAAVPPIQIKTPFMNYEAISFADIARGKTINDLVEPSAKNVAETEQQMNPDSMDLPRDLLIGSICGNDEDMPVLRPETSSSTAASRSDSFAERMQSIDEDVSSSSNHSTLPQAPVLNKESGEATSFANGISKRRSSSQGKLDLTTGEHQIFLDDNTDELALDNLASHRNRSDSLSVRSCGSGSQSDKIKTLDDVSTNEKESLSNPDLVDSDSNDSLTTESSDFLSLESGDLDGEKFKEDCIRFISNKVSANTMWQLRKELKRLKKENKYFKFGKLTPLAAGLMHDLFCQSLP